MDPSLGARQGAAQLEQRPQQVVGPATHLAEQLADGGLERSPGAAVQGEQPGPHVLGDLLVLLGQHRQQVRPDGRGLLLPSGRADPTGRAHDDEGDPEERDECGDRDQGQREGGSSGHVRARARRAVTRLWSSRGLNGFTT
jgi:hypothetical protein